MHTCLPVKLDGYLNAFIERDVQQGSCGQRLHRTVSKKDAGEVVLRAEEFFFSSCSGMVGHHSPPREGSGSCSLYHLKQS